MTLQYESAGSGTNALLLIHGYPLTSQMWRAQVDALAGERWRVIAVDLPGFGRSPGAMTSMEAAADAIREVLDGIGAERVVLAGFSMGGYVAFACARQYPERLRGLILIDTKADPDNEDAKQGRHAMAARVRAEGPQPAIDAVLPRLVADSTFTGRPEIVRRIAEVAAGATVEGIASALEAMAARESSVDLLGQIVVPTIVIHGHDDQLMPVDQAQAMAAQIPGARFIVIPDAGHTTPLEAPDAVIAAIRDFLGAL